MSQNGVKRDVMDGEDAICYACTSPKELSILANSTGFANLCNPRSDRLYFVTDRSLFSSLSLSISYNYLDFQLPPSCR